MPSNSVLQLFEEGHPIPILFHYVSQSWLDENQRMMKSGWIQSSNHIIFLTLSSSMVGPTFQSCYIANAKVNKCRKPWTLYGWTQCRLWSTLSFIVSKYLVICLPLNIRPFWILVQYTSPFQGSRRLVFSFIYFQSLSPHNILPKSFQHV